MGVIYLPENCYEDRLPQSTGFKILILQGIQDPGNIGNLIRNAAAFHFDGVLLDYDCADPFSPKAIQASSGSILSLWIRRTKNLYIAITELKEKGYYIIATDLQGESDSSCFKNRKIALVLGSEGKGIPKKILSEASSIFNISHDKNAVESLNVASTGAICMYIVNSIQDIKN